MLVTRYDYFKNKINNEFKDLVCDTQSKLNTSKSKQRDYNILSKFFSKICEKTCDAWKYPDYEELWMDSKSMMPMPESVLKQLSIQLFKIKNLNPLFDLGIWEGYNLDA